LAPHKIGVGWITHIYPVARRAECLRRAVAGAADGMLECLAWENRKAGKQTEQWKCACGHRRFSTMVY